MVGSGTLAADNPRLTTRGVSGASPTPMVLDRRLRSTAQSRLFDPVGTGEQPRRGAPIVLCSPGAARRRPDRCAALQERGVTVAPVPNPGLPGVLAEAKRRGIGSLMVEGGGEILHAFLRAGFVDAVVVTVAPLILQGYRITGGANGAELPGIDAMLAKWFVVGDDGVVILHRSDISPGDKV